MTSTRASTITKWVVVWFLISVIMVFFVIRVTTDSANLASGVAPSSDDFARRYFDNPAIAYSHIVPGVLYLLGATLQLSRKVRTRHLQFHRRLGRWVLGLGMVSGVMAIVVGIVMPFGGISEGSASVVFGLYFVGALLIAFRSIRRFDIGNHRRWMIRAFAVGLAVGTIRIWIGIFEGFGVFEFQDAFGPAFWIALSMHAIVAEVWIRRRPEPPESFRGRLAFSEPR